MVDLRYPPAWFMTRPPLPRPAQYLAAVIDNPDDFFSSAIVVGVDRGRVAVVKGDALRSFSGSAPCQKLGVSILVTGISLTGRIWPIKAVRREWAGHSSRHPLDAHGPASGTAGGTPKASGSCREMAGNPGNQTNPKWFPRYCTLRSDSSPDLFGVPPF